MTAHEHTPGPWTIHYDPNDRPVIVDDPEQNIHQIVATIGQCRASAANAALIAAAPDLLVAAEEAQAALDWVIQTIKQAIDPNQVEALTNTLNRLDIAIDKAAGSA